MPPTNSQISEEFSKGNFAFCYDQFADEAEWKIIGNKTVKGKENVVACCEQMSKEMASATLTNFNRVEQNNSIVIEGHCTFTDAGNNTSEVSYCDCYHFTHGKITSITSYCI